MAKQTYIVNTDNLIVHEGKGYTRHAEIELTQEQYENVKADVLPKSVEELDNGEKSVEDLTKAELEALSAERGIEVVGTGKDGAVLKEDLVKALK
ncbi:hypothetical protein [Macrococcus brunensis]|uniref:hypothetical protein n=1 Tax=Macrococcus brunensis TaxID=198483 RepID=UPI001EF12D91|nr:hypothetical protein [Macrococcus brunensis]ULG70874.1 hypothetical protein MGG12_05785 [Macrococcus brunensis]